MSAPLLTDLLAVAVQAAREAGRIHQQYAGRAFEVRSKTTFSDLVTEVDALAEAAIREVVAARYPDHAVLGEEEGQQGDGEYRWVVDPLDGTVNYAHGFPVYCASVAVEHHGQRLAGAVYDPTRDELFTATLGGGAHLNGAAIHVSATASLRAPALISTGFPYDATERRFMGPLERLLAGGVPLRRPGAAALDLCYVACGRLDGYWEIGLKPWDSAAGALIVTEAGGLVSDVHGHPGPHGEMLVAANERLHHELLAVLRGDG
ncbi:inositol monophosphatase family protein [Deinococcus sonorensis]|uniref:Inositol-1-monophosphatase n=2 Tax=Deinococcus sonorensis TaxID=309891 RepID=A0AAU7U6S8_9DEIO